MAVSADGFTKVAVGSIGPGCPGNLETVLASGFASYPEPSLFVRDAIFLCCREGSPVGIVFVIEYYICVGNHLLL